MTFTTQAGSSTGLRHERPAQPEVRRNPLRELLLERLEDLARAVFSTSDARRDAFLSASVDMKDYERRLKCLDAQQQ
jgi:hypothetical protein